ncbi:MAG: AAA family ATPase [Eubacteriales bacterium]
MNDLREILRHLDPGACDYTQWCEVGMALKHEGYSAEDWETWSAGDRARYHKGECRRKWETFRGSSDPVTGGTIYQLAVDKGWRPEADIQGGFLDWETSFVADGRVIDPSWVESREVEKPSDNWHPAKELKRYLETLFEPSETVGIVAQSRLDTEKGKYIPRNAGMSFNVAELLEKLSASGDDIGAVIGDYDKAAGAWVRFNPLDGKGMKNANVTEYRYALVESDTLDIEKQNALIRELELPVAVLVHSGGKSLHAIVRIDAPDYTEYQKRVNYLYSICQKNGMEIDRQNKNPSRLSRLPGCMRGDKKQYIVDTNIGKGTWDEWKEYIESINDDLPDFENIYDIIDDLPPKAPEVIKGILRKGHKMLIVGASKTGKSFLLMELCLAIASGEKWIGWECSKGRVLYVNLEVDKDSCSHRFRDAYLAMGIPKETFKSLDIWNLRGQTENMEKLVPKLVRRAKKHEYKAIIIDPIYKVLTGDENSAEQMAKFCNQFDKIAFETGAAVIYVHHHSKGAQGGKRAMDRASGSGVFGRDPDALIDLIELPLSTEQKQQTTRNAALDAGSEWLKKNHYDYWASLPQAPDYNMPEDYYNAVRGEAKEAEWLADFQKVMYEAGEAAGNYTAIRADATLREFKKPKPVNLWFRHPIHEVDESGMLADIQPEEDGRSRSRKNLSKSGKKNKTQEDRDAEYREKFEQQFAMMDFEGKGKVKKDEFLTSTGYSQKTLERRIALFGGKYSIDSNGYIRND